MLLRFEIGKGDVVVDATYTLFAAQRFAKTGKVWAFEPDPNACELLRRNLSGYDNELGTLAAIPPFDQPRRPATLTRR